MAEVTDIVVVESSARGGYQQSAASPGETFVSDGLDPQGGAVGRDLDLTRSQPGPSWSAWDDEPCGLHWSY